VSSSASTSRSGDRVALDTSVAIDILAAKADARLHRRGLVQAFRLLRNRDRNADSTRAFHAAISFADAEAFASGFAAVEHEGIRSGLHGLMVAVIKDFTAEVFGDLDVAPPTR
jgi:hypothetical protein